MLVNDETVLLPAKKNCRLTLGTRLKGLRASLSVKGKVKSLPLGFILCPGNMIDIFIITNTMHTIGVDKITLFKTT